MKGNKKKNNLHSKLEKTNEGNESDTDNEGSNKEINDSQENSFDEEHNDQDNPTISKNEIIADIVLKNKILLSQKSNLKFITFCELLELCLKQKSRTKNK